MGGLDGPLQVVAPPGDDRLFVVLQPGEILLYMDNFRVAKPFLNIREKTKVLNETGLHSLVFHPQYEENGYFFINYTDTEGDTRIERYRVSEDPDVADPDSAELVLAVEQPFLAHNDGLMLFGPDGKLWIGFGDGGGEGDPLGNAQDTSNLLGSILRIDVDALPYDVPADNPYVLDASARPEIWASGLRNPWRFWIDAVDGLLYVADVGQDDREEVNVVSLERSGVDFGWNRLEGSKCFRSSSCDKSDGELPLIEYGHDDGCSVTGGLVYRGTAIPDLIGHYVYSDFCSGWIRSFRYEEGRLADHRQWDMDPVGELSSFGLDGRGELYAVTLSGSVFRFLSAAS